MTSDTLPQLTDSNLLALCVYDEARGEFFEGQVAVAQVVLNRQRLKYQSDGTMMGTVLRPNQFSGFWFDMENGKYVRVCSTLEEAQKRAVDMYNSVRMVSWATALRAGSMATLNAASVLPLPNDAVLYYNPGLVKDTPAWAVPENFITTIGHHAFYRDPPKET